MNETASPIQTATYFAHLFLGIAGFLLNLIVLMHLWQPKNPKTSHYQQPSSLYTAALVRKKPRPAIKFVVRKRRQRLPKLRWRSFSVVDIYHNTQHSSSSTIPKSIELDELVPRKRTTPPNYTRTFLFPRVALFSNKQRRNSCPGAQQLKQQQEPLIAPPAVQPRQVEWVLAPTTNNPTTILTVEKIPKTRRRHSPAYEFDFSKSMLTTHIINACWAEMLVSVLHCGGQLSFHSASWINKHQQLTDELPVWLRTIRPLGLYAVAFITAAVSIDRYLAVLYPLHHTALTHAAKRARARFFMLVCWLLAICCSIPKALIYAFANKNIKAFHWSAHRFHELYQLTVMYYLPALVVCFCYTRIFITVYCRHRRHCRSNTNITPASSPLRVPFSRLSSTASQLYAWTTSTSTVAGSSRGVRSQLCTSTRTASLNNDDKLLRTLRLSIRFVCTFLICAMPYATVRVITVTTTHDGYCQTDTWCAVEALLLVLATSHCVVNPLLFYGRRLYRSLACKLIHKIVDT